LENNIGVIQLSTVPETRGFIAVCKNEMEEQCFRLMLFGSLKSWFD